MPLAYPIWSGVGSLKRYAVVGIQQVLPTLEYAQRPGPSLLVDAKPYKQKLYIPRDPVKSSYSIFFLAAEERKQLISGGLS